MFEKFAEDVVRRYQEKLAAVIKDITKLPEGIRRHLRLSILDDPNSLLEIVPESWDNGAFKPVDFNRVMGINRQTPVTTRNSVLPDNSIISLNSRKSVKPINITNMQSFLPQSRLQNVLKGIMGKRAVGFNKQGSYDPLKLLITYII